MAEVRRLRSTRKKGLGEVTREQGNPALSTRGKQTPGVPGLYAPGVPEGALKPSFQFYTPEDVQGFKAFTPEQAEELTRIIAKGLQVAFDHYSIYAQAKPYDDYNMAIVNCAANATTRLDNEAVSMGMTARRALLIINPAAAANVLWVGRANVAIAAGIPINGGNGSFLASLHERAPVYGIIAVQTAVPVIWFS